MSQATFDDLTDVYEAMIDWPRRLANEGPFFRRLFERYEVHRVADAACGTGQHAQLFHSWGCQVEGSDISPGMIQRARESFGEPEGLRWEVRGFNRPAGPPGAFDAVICIGNSLALASDADAALDALGHMLNATRSGGVMVVQVLNLWSLPDGPCLWQKSLKAALPAGEAMILKGVHRCAGRGYVELVALEAGEPAVSMRARAVPFLGFQADDLERAARSRGAGQVTLLGGYQHQPYDPAVSTDLVLIAVKD